jgi:hypothetical protein
MALAGVGKLPTASVPPFNQDAFSYFIETFLMILYRMFFPGSGCDRKLIKFSQYGTRDKYQVESHRG